MLRGVVEGDRPALGGAGAEQGAGQNEVEPRPREPAISNTGVLYALGQRRNCSPAHVPSVTRPCV